MQMTQEEIHDVLDDTENTKVIHIEPDDHHIYYTYVTKINDKYYTFWLNWHPDVGYLIDDDVELIEVEPVEVKTIEWKIKQ